MTHVHARWTIASATLLVSMACSAAAIPVSDVNGLRNAMQNASAGDEIVLANGTYVVDSNLSASAAGSALEPITVRGAAAHGALVRFSNGGDVAEGFKVSGAYWRFEGLDIEGACAVDSNCEHAFHLAGNADFTVIRDNDVRDFNAQIKSNGSLVSGVYVYPDDVLVERNVLHDTRARNTDNPVTKIDVVGGRRWLVRANTIYDFQKNGGDTISYAAFLKGNSRDGVFERNLVRCSRFTSGGVRLGLSFGGGGTSPNLNCEDSTCTPEHQDGIMRNNIIMNCNDVGIYLNKGANSRIQHNTLYATAGIDVRFAASTADLRNNLMAGAIRNRDGGTSTSSGNLTGVTPGQFSAWFVAASSVDFNLLDGAALVNQGVSAPLVTNDFCGADRNDGQPDIGAIEYPPTPICSTDVGGGGAQDRIYTDGFE